MSSQENTFSNENVQVTVNHQPGTQVSLEIKVSPTATVQAYKAAIKSVKKEVSIPGFRKGKVPEEFIEQRYGQAIEAEWKEKLINSAFSDAVQLTKLQPFRANSVKCSKLDELSCKTGAKFTVEYEAAPTVPTMDLSQIQLHEASIKEVTPEDVQNELENVRHYYAQWNEITDRPIQENDYVDLDIEKLDEPQEMICESTRFLVAKDKMAAWMHDILIGAKVEDVLEAVSVWDPTQKGVEESKFVPTKCRVTVKAIRTATLPELDETFATKVGAQGIDDLKEKVKVLIQNRAKNEVRNDLKHQLDAILIEKYPFEVPATLIETELERRKAVFHSLESKKNKTKEQIEKEIESLQDLWLKEVQHYWQLRLILYRFAIDHNISVSEEELMRYVLEGTMHGDFQLPKDEEKRKSYMEYKKEQLLLLKAQDHLLDHVLGRHHCEHC